VTLGLALHGDDLLDARRISLPLRPEGRLAPSLESLGVAVNLQTAPDELGPARHRATISPRTRSPWTPSPAWRITAMIYSTRGGSAG